MVSMEKRLRKELMNILSDRPEGISVNINEIEKNLKEWKVTIQGAKGSLYENEEFCLRFRFSDKYPFDSPEVVFIGPNIPIHSHIYSNGHICLSILTDAWSAALSVRTVCLSIISMLSSATEKKRPPDDLTYIKTCKKSPKETKWWYHDDTI